MSSTTPGGSPLASLCDVSDPRAVLAQQLRRQHRTLHALKALFAREEGEADGAAAMLLATLAESGPLRAGALAEAVHSDPSTVSRQTAALVTRGLLERQPDPADGRAARLALTAAGEEFLRTLHTRRLAMLGEALRDWEPAELERFAASLRRFNDSLDRVRREVLDGTSPLAGTTPATTPAEDTP
ncbi:hypothetical protein NUM3379_39730 [Kineococcus sp. NUM-3379]